MARGDSDFTSGGDRVAAWLYCPDAPAAEEVPCVIMGHGFSLTRHDGLAVFAERFAQTGVASLVFDYRCLGDSGGAPRQRFRVREQAEDWRNAIAHARSLGGIASSRIVLWGYSIAAGHAVVAAARDERLAAVLVLNPMVDALGRARAASPLATARLMPRAIADRLGRHNLVAVTGPPG